METFFFSSFAQPHVRAVIRQREIQIICQFPGFPLQCQVQSHETASRRGGERLGGGVLSVCWLGGGDAAARDVGDEREVIKKSHLNVLYCGGLEKQNAL